MYRESRQQASIVVTPEIAERFLAMESVPNERPYHPVKGKYYADLMDAREFRRVEVAVCKCNANGITYRVNGQHTCHAVILRGKPYPGVISYFVADSMEDVWRLYATFDVHAPRTERQFMAGRRPLFADTRLHDVPYSVLNLCGTALFMLGDIGTTPVFESRRVMAKTIKADLVGSHVDEVLFVTQFAEKRHMMRVGVVTAMIATRRANDKEAGRFWEAIATGEMLGKTSCEYRLREVLLGRNSLNVPRGGKNAQRYTYYVCISWWNSWRSGEKRSIVKVRSMNSTPKVCV